MIKKYFWAILILSLFTVSCNKRKIKNLKEMIVGTWLQSVPVCVDCKRYVFSEDGTFYIEDQPSEVYNYDIIEKDSISIIFDMNDMKEYVHYFQYSNDFKILEINNFIQSLVYGDIDIELTKIN